MKVIKWGLPILLMLLLAGCGSEHAAEPSAEQAPAYEWSLYSTVQQYAPTMSSVPGLPLVLKCRADGQVSAYTLELSCGGGELLLYDEDSGLIEYLGSTASLGFEDTVLYWTPIGVDGNGVDNHSTALTAALLSTKSERCLEKRVYSIPISVQGYYSLNEEYEAIPQ